MRTCLWCLIVLAVASCSSAPPRPQPANYALHISSSPALNPDTHGRSSPLVVRIYELRAINNFEGMPFFDLQDRDATVLGSDLLGRDELILRPGESRVVLHTGNPDTRFIGVVAAYRDLERSVWRSATATPTPPQTRRLFSGVGLFRSTEPFRYSITLERNAVYIAPLTRTE